MFWVHSGPRASLSQSHAIKRKMFKWSQEDIVHQPRTSGAEEPVRAAKVEAVETCLVWKRIGETESFQQERGKDTT